MRTDTLRRLFADSVTMMTMLLVVTGGLAAGCGGSTPETAAPLGHREPPPIDLQAPSSFQTATFAFG